MRVVGARDADSTVLAGLFPAIHRRHTDRRRFSHRPVPSGLIRALVDAAARADVLLVPVEHARERFTAVLDGNEQDVGAGGGSSTRARISPGWDRRVG